MRSSARRRRFGASIETLLLIGLVAAIGFGLAVVNRSRRTTSSTGAAADVALLQETAAPSETVAPIPTPSLPVSSPSIPAGNDPLLVAACDYRETNIDVFVRNTPVIVRGTVKQVIPAQWSTPNGKRPANPHSPASAGVIYRPVIIQVEEYLRGEQPQRTLMIMARGGTVGQDSVEFCGGRDPRYTYQEGEQVVLFLYPPEILLGPVPPATPGGPPLWAVWDRYTITADGQANNGIRQLPVQQLRDEIQAAVRALPSASPSAVPSIAP